MLSHLIERRETIIGDASAYLRFLSLFRNTRSGVRVDDYTALNHSAMWAGLDFISSTLAQLPMRLFRKDSQGNSERQNTPVSRMIARQPNIRITPFRWKQLQQAQAICYGNGYAFIERNDVGKAVAIWPLPPRDTKPAIFDDTLMYDTKLRGRRHLLPASDVFHIAGFSLNDPLMGLPFLEYAREVIGVGLAAQDFASTFFSNGATPSIVVTHPDQLGDSALARLSDQLNRVLGGNANHHKVAVLDEGMKQEVLTFEPQKTQLMEMRKDNRVELAGMMRIPPQMIGIYDRATWANAEQMDIFVEKYTLASWVIRWEEEANAKLLSQREQDAGFFFKINTSALLRGDIEARSNFYKTMIQGAMSPNEIRDKEDLQKLPGLDEPFIPLNMAPASDAGNPDDDDRSRRSPPVDPDD